MKTLLQLIIFIRCIIFSRHFKIIFAILILANSAKAQFTHPGLISSGAELDKVKSIVNGSAAHPMKDGYNVMLSTNFAKLTYSQHPYATVIVVGSGSSPEEKAIRDDAVAAYAHALQWVVTGKKEHSDKAIQIMNDWAATIKDIVPQEGSPAVQDKLESDWYCPIWLEAAEIIRHYNNGAAGWSSADVTKFNNNMVSIFKTKALAWAGSQGCCPNQALSVCIARMSLGVYLNDQSLFDNGKNYFTSKVLARAIASNGEILELNRAPEGDCGHSNYNIEAVFGIAEIAWHQKINLYEYKLDGETTPRMVKGIEYMSLNIVSGTQTSEVGFVQCSSLKPVGIETAYNHYIYRLGTYSLPNTLNLIKKIRPVNQGSGKFIPWDTFTHADLDKGSVAPNTPPTVSITSPANNATFTSPASITINANASDSDGSVAKVEFFNGSANLGEDASSPYSFAWNGVAAGTYSITAKATDDKGAATTSSVITITVNSPCTPTDIKPYVQVNGGTWQNSLNATLDAGGTLKFGPQPNTGGSWSWAGPNGFSSARREVSINNIQTSQAGNYVATYTNADGCKSIATFVVTVNSTTPNTPPTVSITSPANNSSVTAPANITINANASDSDGSVTKVEFYNGTTKLGEDAVAPYSFAWNNVAAGTYTITAKATDNKGASTTSASVSVTVKESADACSGVPTYTENGGYVDGSKVQNAGGLYKCKPYPYTGWCNGAAWAYAPGTGSYWTDAWDKVGTCSGARGALTETANRIELYPNPTENTSVIKLNVTDAMNAEVTVMNSLGVIVSKTTLDKNLEGKIDLSGMKSGIYMIQIKSNDQVWFEKLIKE